MVMLGGLALKDDVYVCRTVYLHLTMILVLCVRDRLVDLVLQDRQERL